MERFIEKDKNNVLLIVFDLKSSMERFIVHKVRQSA